MRTPSRGLCPGCTRRSSGIASPSLGCFSSSVEVEEGGSRGYRQRPSNRPPRALVPPSTELGLDSSHSLHALSRSSACSHFRSLPCSARSPLSPFPHIARSPLIQHVCIQRSEAQPVGGATAKTGRPAQLVPRQLARLCRGFKEVRGTFFCGLFRSAGRQRDVRVLIVLQGNARTG